MNDIRDNACEMLKDLTRLCRDEMIKAKTNNTRGVWSDLYKKAMRRRLKALRHCYKKERVSV